MIDIAVPYAIAGLFLLFVLIFAIAWAIVLGRGVPYRPVYVGIASLFYVLVMCLLLTGDWLGLTGVAPLDLILFGSGLVLMAAYSVRTVRVARRADGRMAYRGRPLVVVVWLLIFLLEDLCPGRHPWCDPVRPLDRDQRLPRIRDHSPLLGAQPWTIRARDGRCPLRIGDGRYRGAQRGRVHRHRTTPPPGPPQAPAAGRETRGPGPSAGRSSARHERFPGAAPRVPDGSVGIRRFLADLTTIRRNASAGRVPPPSLGSFRDRREVPAEVVRDLAHQPLAVLGPPGRPLEHERFVPAPGRGPGISIIELGPPRARQRGRGIGKICRLGQRDPGLREAEGHVLRSVAATPRHDDPVPTELVGQLTHRRDGEMVGP